MSKPSKRHEWQKLPVTPRFLSCWIERLWRKAATVKELWAFLVVKCECGNTLLLIMDRRICAGSRHYTRRFFLPVSFAAQALFYCGVRNPIESEWSLSRTIPATGNLSRYLTFFYITFVWINFTCYVLVNMQYSCRLQHRNPLHYVINYIFICSTYINKR